MAEYTRTRPKDGAGNYLINNTARVDGFLFQIQIAHEIRDSAIVPVLTGCSMKGDDECYIFDSALSGAEEIILDQVRTNHRDNV